jgi:hypothetical protein
MRPGHKSSGRLKKGFESDYVFIFCDMQHVESLHRSLGSGEALAVQRRC